MKEWILDNWIALYGAVVGTAALLINFSQYLHTKGKDKVKLKVSCNAHPNFDENVRKLKDSQIKEPWERLNLVEVYTVTVTNMGNIEAYIENVGVHGKNRLHKSALVNQNIGGGNILADIAQTSIDPIPPKSARTFQIYLKAGEDPFTVVQCYAIDKTGRKWSASV